MNQLRGVETAPPKLADIEARRRWSDERRLPVGRVRIATIATVVAIVGYLGLTVRPLLDTLPHLAGMQGSVLFLAALWQLSAATLVPTALLVWALRLVRRPGVGPQMLTRAVLWSNLVVGTLIAGNFLAGPDRAIGVMIAWACAAAILALGSRGLDDVAPGDLFAPVRFRGTLLLALIMAFADAQTLLFSAVMQLRIGVTGWNLLGTLKFAGPITAAALVMIVTVWGLYRLRTWALLLNLAANIAIATLAVDGTLHVAGPVAAALAMTAGVQMFLPVPILAVALGDKKAGKPLLRSHASRLLPTSVVAIAVFAATQFAFSEPSGWLTGPARAFARGLIKKKAPRAMRRGLPATSSQNRVEVGADWSGRSVQEEDFEYAQMRGVDLSGAYGQASFRAADLREATLRGAKLQSSQLYRANLTGADATSADLRGAMMRETDLTDANFAGADLRRVDLSHAIVAGANFKGVNLRGAVVGNLPVELEGATCPDGRPATAESGCAGRLGEIEPNSPRYVGWFTPLASGWESEGCWRLSQRELTTTRYLRFMGATFVQVGEDAFISVEGTLTFDRSDGRVRATYEHVRCGIANFERER
ncbi:MAG: pentapeptide repeat-containing protein [Myxococcota bacterium]